MHTTKKNISLKTQFFIISAIMIAFLIISFIIVFVFTNIKDRLITDFSRKSVSTLIADEVRQTSQDLTKYCQLYVMSNGNVQYWNEYWNIVNWRAGTIPRPTTFQKELSPGRQISQMDLLKETGCTQKEMDLVALSSELSNTLVAVEEQAMESIKQNKYIDGPRSILPGETITEFAQRIVFDDAYQAEVAKIMEPIDTFFTTISERTDQIVLEDNKVLTVFQYLLSIFLILTGIIIVIFIFFLNKAVILPIVKTSNVFSSLSNGNLTQHMNVNASNEVGKMAKDYNSTIDSIRKLILSIQNSAANLANTGDELSAHMTQTAGAINQIDANISGTKEQMMTQAASVTETAATVDEIIKNIKKLNSSIESQSACVTESSASIEQMVANINSITDNLKTGDAAINELSSATNSGKQTVSQATSVTEDITKASGSLLEASNIIQHIASQTNLLAMNAAIEAAHAGEEGKGFAVVADEIRKLAEESSIQGKSITSTLKGLSGEISTLNDSIRTVSNSFDSIYSLANQVQNISNKLTEAMLAQSEGSSEILAAIKEINTVTLTVRDGSIEMLNEGETISQEMAHLNDLTVMITNSMNEMAVGAAQINEAVQEVNEITQKNKDNISELITETNHFTV